MGLLAGLSLTLAGAIVALRSDQPEPTDTGPAIVQSPLRTVATGTPVSATLAQWIGQRRAFTTADGRLMLVYPGPRGLLIVSDQGNGGRTWRSPVEIPGIEAVSVSVDVAADDRLHLISSDEERVRYHEVVRRREGWRVATELEIDPATARQTVDIAWDEANQLAHVVWVSETESGMQPKWAAISAATDPPSIIETQELAPVGEAGAALVNVALLPGDRVLTTYRRPDVADGWFAQIGTFQDGTFVWAEEEGVPGAGQIGAASMEVDDKGTVHLALRDDSKTAIVYYKRTEKSGWTSGFDVADGNTFENVDFPSLALDPHSRLVYLFYQTDAFIPESTEVVVLIRDPATGWEGPHRLAQAVPGGAVYPVTSGKPSAQPLVFWTALGSGPAIEVARVAAP